VSVAGPAGLEIAPLGRRSVARAIDVVVFVVPAALAGASVSGLYVAYRRWRGGEDDNEFALHEREFPVFRRLGQSPAWRVGFRVAWVPIEVRMRNRRSPGDRAMGIRRVDARTGGPVSVRSILVSEAVRTAWSELHRLVQRPSQRRFEERRRLVKAELSEARGYHEGDTEAQKRAMLEVAKRYRLRPWSWCARGLLGSVPLQLPALWSARNQTAPERVAGIVTVRDSSA
jgi:hypothetical protein